MIKGVTRNISLNPVGYKDIDLEETFIPYQIDLRNGRQTDAGNWEKRNGYALWKSVAISEPINTLIPVGNGYAITNYGKVYELKTTPVELTGKTTSGQRATWIKFDDKIIVCGGGQPIKIYGGNTALLSGSPPTAKFVGMISSYCIMSGHNATEFMWSASNNAENWTTGDSGFANIKADGDTIKFMKVFKEKVFFFKENSIEVWYNRGGDTPFVRLNEFWINKGLGADYSVVEANNTLYWLGNDGDFYMLNGNQAQVISKSYRRYLDTIQNKSECYGIDFRKENCIKWFFPTDKKCISYDYLKNVISEDNGWLKGNWDGMRINSYMELNGEQYFGDYEPTGKIYHWSKDYEDDDGNRIRTYRRFKIKLTENGHNARVNRLKFAFKRGIGTSTYPIPRATFRVRFDNKITWETAEVIDLGAVGDIEPYQDFDSIGIGREMEIEIEHADSTNYLLRDIYLTTQELGV